MVRALICLLVSSVISVGYAADFSGVVVGVDGLTRSEAKVSPSGTSIWNGQVSDRQGRFVIKDFKDKPKVWIVSSQHSKAMGILSIPENYKDKTVTTVLNCREGKVEGRVVDKDGKGIRGRKIEIVIESSKGETYILPASRKTDKYGLFEAPVPFGDGVKIQARITGNNQEEKKYTSEKVALSYGQIRKYLPTIVIGGGNPVESDDGRVQFSGRILNENRQPIAGVEVEMYFEMAETMAMWSKESMTDKDGRWSMRVPKAGSILSVRLDHQEYQGYHFDRTKRPSLDELKDGSNILTMKRGVRIKGVVTDEQGKPVINAVVATGWLYSGGKKIVEDSTTDRTSADGSFSIGGMPQKELSMTVIAEGYAPCKPKVQITENTKPISITLSKGWVYKGRLVTKDGKPLEDIKVSVSDWTIGIHRESIDRNGISGPDGYFSIDGLPVEGKLRLTYGRSRTPYICFSKEITSEQSELDVVTVYKQVYIAGKVVDGETGEPITEFMVRNGLKDKGNGGDGYRWSGYYKGKIKSEDGTFREKWGGYLLTFPYDGSCHMKVTAEGYLPEITPPVVIGKDYEPFVIRMTKAQPWTGTVVDESGKAVKGVQVGRIGENEKAFIKDGQFDLSPWSRQAEIIVKSGFKGVFSVPACRGKVLLMAVHPGKGYAVIDSEKHKNGTSVKLTPWASIEGTNAAFTNEEYVAGIMMPSEYLGRSSTEKIRWELGWSSFSNKKFTFNYLPSEPMMLGQFIRGQQSNHINITPIPGKTHKIVLASGGCTVTGKIILPWMIDGKPVTKGAYRDPGQLYAVAFRVDPKEILPDVLIGKTHSESRQIYGDIENVYEGSKIFQKRFMPVIKDDGTFTIGNLVPGKYDLVINLHRPLGDEQQCGRGFREAATLVSFTVGKKDKKLKLADIKLVSAFK